MAYVFCDLQLLVKGEKGVQRRGTLIFFCGKMGAGKSTLSCRIAQDRNAVLLCEDEWLESLYPNQIRSLADYIAFSSRLKPAVAKLVQNILRTGTNVVMDFPANTVPQRSWFKNLFTEINAPHELIYLDVPDEVCLNRIAKRRIEQPERAATDTEAMFEQVTKYFQVPEKNEGFNIIKAVHGA